MWPLVHTAFAMQALYRAYSIEAAIPFDASAANGAVPFTEDVHTTVRLQSDDGVLSGTYHPIVDTGSCGFVISAADLPDWSEEEASRHPLGWEYLSSSKILYSGRWIPKNVYFTNAKVEVKARIPVLAVETKTICPSYEKAHGTNACPCPKDGTPPVVIHMPTGIRVMGVGFGREHDGMPQGTPDKNALLNVRSIGGVNVTDDTRFRNGYVLNRHGITIGLTPANTDGMHFSKLSLVANPAGRRDWAQVDCCMAVDEAKCIPGVALVDTGVLQMYMTLPLGTKVNRSDPPLLDDGSVVEVQIGSPGQESHLGREKFIVGDEKDMREGVTPSSVRMTLADPKRNPPHVNTGRHFLRAWQVAFDSDGGFFGVGRAP